MATRVTLSTAGLAGLLGLAFWAEPADAVALGPAARALRPSLAARGTDPLGPAGAPTISLAPAAPAAGAGARAPAPGKTGAPAAVPGETGGRGGGAGLALCPPCLGAPAPATEQAAGARGAKAARSLSAAGDLTYRFARLTSRDSLTGSIAKLLTTTAPGLELYVQLSWPKRFYVRAFGGATAYAFGQPAGGFITLANDTQATWRAGAAAGITSFSRCQAQIELAGERSLMLASESTNRLRLVGVVQPAAALRLRVQLVERPVFTLSAVGEASSLIGGASGDLTASPGVRIGAELRADVRLGEAWGLGGGAGYIRRTQGASGHTSQIDEAIFLGVGANIVLF